MNHLTRCAVVPVPRIVPTKIYLGITFVVSLLFWGCDTPTILQDTQAVIAQFNPDEGIIPSPSDLLRNAETGQLEIPNDEESLADKTPLERDLIGKLNRHYGWSTQSEGSLTFDDTIDHTTISEKSILVFKHLENSFEIVEVNFEQAQTEDGHKITIIPPSGGWDSNQSYLIAAIGEGHPDGLKGISGKDVVCDAAFWYLRLQENLENHLNAIPGKTLEEQKEKATALEEVRKNYSPYFDHLESLGYPRSSVALLWDFTTTQATEIWMDKRAGKMPLPSDFIRNPLTKKVELPIPDDYDEFRRSNLETLNSYDGFGLSSELIFELTLPINEETLNEKSVLLLEEGPEQAWLPIPIDLETRTGNRSVRIQPKDAPLKPDTFYAVIVTSELKDHNGYSVETMLPGSFVLAKNPVLNQEGDPQIKGLDKTTAQKLEFVRHKTFAATEYWAQMTTTSTQQVAAAWSFKTVSIYDKIVKSRDLAQQLNSDPNPVIRRELSAFKALLDFPIGIMSTFYVDTIFEGYLKMPTLLDAETRRNFKNDIWDIENVRFTMTIPKNVDKNTPLKVVIFGHAIVTERRFVYAVADAMAKRGYATIGIDFPYHGARTHCANTGPLCFPNPFDSEGDMWCPDPCQGNSTCAEDGRCIDNNGEGNQLSKWPILPMYQASGAAFLELDNLPATRDHFYQAVGDLSTLKRSLEVGNWKSAIGYELDPNISYVGQSLGGIIGGVFAAVQPSLQRVVLNVPGGNLVDIFRESGHFKSHFSQFIRAHDIIPGTEDYDKLLLAARWLVDVIDPINYARYLQSESFEPTFDFGPRSVMIQKAKGDFIIPNFTTEKLAKVGDIKMFDYSGTHAFIVVPIEPAYYSGLRDIGKFIKRGVFPDEDE